MERSAAARRADGAGLRQGDAALAAKALNDVARQLNLLDSRAA